MKKWLLLSDPDNSSSGARGYLKVNMIIVGTGDDPPVHFHMLLFISFLLTEGHFQYEQYVIRGFVFVPWGAGRKKREQ